MLRSREKAVLVLGGAAVAFILLVFFAVVPAVNKVRTLSRASAVAERELAEVRKMRPEIERMDREVRPRAMRIGATGGAPDSTSARLTAALQDAGFPQSSFTLKAGGTRQGDYYAEESVDLRVENVTYLEVVTAQSISLANQRVEVDLLRQRMDATVLLIKALGGGWDVSKLPQ